MDKNEPLPFRLHNTIGFVRAMKQLAKENKDKKIEVDEETLQIIYDLLSDCKEQIEHV